MPGYTDRWRQKSGTWDTSTVYRPRILYSHTSLIKLIYNGTESIYQVVKYTGYTCIRKIRVIYAYISILLSPTLWEFNEQVVLITWTLNRYSDRTRLRGLVVEHDMRSYYPLSISQQKYNSQYPGKKIKSCKITYSNGTTEKVFLSEDLLPI